MWSEVRRYLVAVLLLILAAPASAAHADEIVVLERPDDPVATETAERERELGFDAERRFTRVVKGFAADLTAAQERELRDDPEVAAIVPDRPVRAAAALAPGEFVPPGVQRIGAVAPDGVRGAASGAVAVVDTGISLTHPDLNVSDGVDCIHPGTPADDDNGHGTHVAGTIGAENDGGGVTGVAPGTELYAVRVLDENGNGSTSSVMCGLEWVAANAASLGITVVNLSLGGPGIPGTCETDPERALYCALDDVGVTPVVSAGNDGIDFAREHRLIERVCVDARVPCPELPAAYPEVLTVAAITDTDGAGGGTGPVDMSASDGDTCEAFFTPADGDDRPASFSNYATRSADEEHLVAAPGMCIESTVRGGGTGFMDGTSMASPHVAGLVALCKGEAGTPGPCEGLTNREIFARMRAGGAASVFTTVPGRLHGPLALLSDPATPTPTVDTSSSSVEFADAYRAPADEPDPTPVTPAPVSTPAPPAPPAPSPVAPSHPVTAVPAAPTAVVARPAAPRVSFAATRIKRLRSKGLRVRIRCEGRCSGLVRLRVSRATARKLRLRSPTLATARVRRAGTVTLRLTKAAKRAVARQRRLTATVVADVRSGQRTVRVTRTLRAKR
jgi:subtilisin